MPFIRKYFGGGEAEPAQGAPDVAIAAASDAALLRSAAGSQGNLGLGGLAVASSTEEEESETEEEEDDEIGELPATDVDFEEEERKKRERIGR